VHHTNVHHTNHPNDLPQATMSSMHNRIVVVEYAAGIRQFTKLLLDGIFDGSIKELREDAYSMIVEPMATKAKPMMNGQPNTKYAALVEAINREDVNLYLHDPDGIESTIGCSQLELVSSRKESIIAALSDGPLVVVAIVHGFRAK
jgi:hypothetical protein